VVLKESGNVKTVQNLKLVFKTSIKCNCVFRIFWARNILGRCSWYTRQEWRGLRSLPESTVKCRLQDTLILWSRRYRKQIITAISFHYVSLLFPGVGSDSHRVSSFHRNLTETQNVMYVYEPWVKVNSSGVNCLITLSVNAEGSMAGRLDFRCSLLSGTSEQWLVVKPTDMAGGPSLTSSCSCFTAVLSSTPWSCFANRFTCPRVGILNHVVLFSIWHLFPVIWVDCL